MRCTFTIRVFFVSLFLLAATSVRSATVTIEPVAVGYWTSPSHINAVSDPQSFPGEPGVYQIDFTLSASFTSADIAAGLASLGDIAFEFNFTNSHLTDDSAFAGYSPYLPEVTADGTGASYTDVFNNVHSDGNDKGLVPLWALSGSMVSNTGEKNIFAGIQATPRAANDPRLSIGTQNQNSHLTNILGNPLHLGTVFVDYDGGGQSIFSVTPPGSLNAFDLFKNSTGQLFSGLPPDIGVPLDQVFNAGSLGFREDASPRVPEPGRNLALIVFFAAAVRFAGARNRRSVLR